MEPLTVHPSASLRFAQPSSASSAAFLVANSSTTFQVRQSAHFIFGATDSAYPIWAGWQFFEPAKETQNVLPHGFALVRGETSDNGARTPVTEYHRSQSLSR